MQVLLNIGLESKTLGKIAPVTAISAAQLRWLNVTGSKLVQSDTEPTLVLEVKTSMDLIFFDNVMHQLAQDLDQDCIAWWVGQFDLGRLTGPRAAEWGEFNLELFFLLDGTRLQEPVAKAA